MQHGAGKVALELLHVLHPRAAPAIDRLVIVKHGERIALGACQHFHPAVLDGVRVLKLIDQHVAKAPPVMREELGLIAPQLKGAQQELGEIDDPIPRAGRLVLAVEPDELAACRIAAVLQILRPASLILVGIDEPLHLARHPAGLIQVLRLDDLADEALLVLGVQDLEALRQTRLAPVQSQQPMGDAVEGADPQGRPRHP